MKNYLQGRQIWLILVLPVAAALAAILLRSLVRTYLLEPVIYLFRAGKVIFEALPQAYCWNSWLVILLPLAIWSLLLHSRKPDRSPNQNERLSRVRDWEELLRQAQRSKYCRWLLALRLADLAVDILAYQERLSPEQTRLAVHHGKLHIPEDIRAYLDFVQEVPSYRRYSELVSARGREIPGTALISQPRKIIEYLETRMETGENSS
ncbi:MAG: hypothetical protein JXB15_01605 [Anaerolineales bacterium]|nr:hypothetical protein [Anaerolineales bacterium]